jgi:lysophospholipase L1-like esterase
MRRILVYGDSNSYGTAPMARLGESPVHAQGVRWPDQMAAALGPGWETVVEGLPGRTTVFDDPVEGSFRNGLRVLPAVLLSQAPLDLLIICLGANDQKQRFGLTAIDIALGIGRLLREARHHVDLPAALVICPPAIAERGALAEMFSGAPARSAALPDRMAGVARTEGAAFLDAGAHIAVDPLDGVHWNAEAHRLLGEVVADRVRALLPSGTG